MNKNYVKLVKFIQTVDRCASYCSAGGADCDTADCDSGIGHPVSKEEIT